MATSKTRQGYTDGRGKKHHEVNWKADMEIFLKDGTRPSL